MAESPRSHLLFAIRKIMGPLIAIVIRAGIRYDEFADLMKSVYVESALRYGVGDWPRLTRARAALATGLTRRDVDHAIENFGQLPRPGLTLSNVISEILQKWHVDPEYVGPYGIPTELDLSPDSKTRSFAQLVHSVAPEIDPASVLVEMLRTKLVIKAGDRFIRAGSRYYIMNEPLTAAQLEYFGRAMTRLAATLQYNMDPVNEAKRFERCVTAEKGLPLSAMPEFEAYARERANTLLVDLDDWLGSFVAKSEPVASDRINTGLNIFLFVDQPDDPTQLSDLVLDGPGDKYQ
jgi:hypothetical protein